MQALPLALIALGATLLHDVHPATPCKARLWPPFPTLGLYPCGHVALCVLGPPILTPPPQAQHALAAVTPRAFLDVAA